MNFSAFFIRRPVTTVVAMALLLVLGLLAAGRIPTDMFPRVDSPVVVVKTAYPGAAASEVETDLTEPIEEALAGLNGLDTLRSTSAEGLSTVIAEFALEVSDQAAAQDVRDQVAALANALPEDAETPLVLLYNPSDVPVATYAVKGAASIERLSEIADTLIRPRLERVDGVGRVELLGDRPAEVTVALDPARLESHRLSLTGVFQAIADANADRPAGRIDAPASELSVRTTGKARDVAALEALPLQTPLGTTVSLGALGRVTLGAAEARSLAAVDGEPAVMLSVRKRADGNTIAVVEAVDEALHVLAPSLPPGVAVVTVRDGSAFIEASVEAVWEALIIGGVLAVGVIWLFLRDWRATLIGGLAMPLSVVAAFTFMQLAGFSFNLLSTLALSLAIGILVDDAVVDLENIHRHIQAGEPPLEAAINATGEIQLAVTATTLTIVAVFVPVAFMDGMIGQFFKEFGLTVAFSVLISLLVARTLTPMLAARFHGGQLPAESADGRLERAYSRLLAWCLDHRRATVALGLATLALALALVPMIPKGFMTTADRGEFNLILELPPGASLETTAARADAVVEVLKRRPEVRHAFTQIGEGGAVDRALIGVELVERRARRLTDRQLARAVLPELRAVPGVAIRVEEIGMMGQSEQNLPLLVVLKGEDLTALERHAGEIARALAGAGGFVDVDTTAGRPRAELVARIDHARAAERGVNPALLAKTLRLATSGEVASRLNVAGEEIDVRVRAARSQRAADERLGALTVPARGGGLVRLDAVARVTREAGMTAIDHRDRSRTVAVTANLRPGYSVGDATARAEALVAGLALPGSVEAAFLGQAEWMHETFGSLQGALLLAVVFIYMILATQFESFLHPLTIMLALPLSLSGAFLALFLGGKELGLVSMIGLIMLMGLVTKNGILLVDFTLQKQREGRSARRALLAAAPLRLRPILMTSTAMIFGMAPIAFEFGAASEFRSPMGIVVVGGLLTSTLLTLFVVPVVFSLFDDLARRLAGRPVAGHADA